MTVEDHTTPTLYRRCVYDTRVDAQWAVFLDVLGIPYDYGQVSDPSRPVGHRRCFWLPKHGFLVFVAPDLARDEDLEVASREGEARSCRSFVFEGQLFIPNGNDYPTAPPAHAYCGGWDHPYHWCQCSECKAFGVQFEGRSDRLPCKECYLCAIGREWKHAKKCERHPDKPSGGCQRSGGNFDKGYNADSERLILAYQTAASVKFPQRGWGRAS